MEADLTQPLTLHGRIDGLVHCAAEIPARCPDPDALYAANTSATRNIFHAALNADVTSIVFCSSMSAFGSITSPEVSPDTPSNEPDAYGRSKIAGEEMLDLLAANNEGLSAVSLRLPGIVGPGSHDNFLSAALEKMLAGQPVNARNPDALFNNILPVNSLSDFVVHLLSHPPKDHAVLTLAGQNPAPIKGVLAAMQTGARTSVPVEFGSGGHTFLISSAAARRLGYRPPDTLAAARQFAEDCREFKGL